MNARRAAAVALPLALACAVLAGAHHSQAMFRAEPVWVKGTVVRYRPVDPHVMLELEERGPEGKVRRWIVEGPRMARLERILELNGGVEPRAFLKVGDFITVCGFPLKAGFAPEKMYTDWQPTGGRFVHGQLIVTPDGRMQSWGPYGKLDNCVRKEDGEAAWVAFLNGNPLAYKQWCDSQAYVRMADVAPAQLVEKVNRTLAEPCR